MKRKLRILRHKITHLLKDVVFLAAVAGVAYAVFIGAYNWWGWMGVYFAGIFNTAWLCLAAGWIRGYHIGVWAYTNYRLKLDEDVKNRNQAFMDMIAEYEDKARARQEPAKRVTIREETSRQIEEIRRGNG